nr:hypothetical protein CFP56_75607 [Quercus suber]
MRDVPGVICKAEDAQESGCLLRDSRCASPGDVDGGADVKHPCTPFLDIRTGSTTTHVYINRLTVCYGDRRHVLALSVYLPSFFSLTFSSGGKWGEEAPNDAVASLQRSTPDIKGFGRTHECEELGQL